MQVFESIHKRIYTLQDFTESYSCPSYESTKPKMRLESLFSVYVVCKPVLSPPRKKGLLFKIWPDNFPFQQHGFCDVTCVNAVTT